MQLPPFAPQLAFTDLVTPPSVASHSDRIAQLAALLVVQVSRSWRFYERWIVPLAGTKPPASTRRLIEQEMYLIAKVFRIFDRNPALVHAMPAEVALARGMVFLRLLHDSMVVTLAPDPKTRALAATAEDLQRRNEALGIADWLRAFMAWT